MNRSRIWAASGLVAFAGGVVFFLLPPIPQDPAYHNFADQRAFLGLPHCLDVLSNAAFLIVGVWGLIFLMRETSQQPGEVFLPTSDRWAYFFFFVGVLLTTFGSAYYHLAPDNARLVYDRLPMAIGFMALLAAVISERVDAQLGTRLLAPLIALGIASVLCWRWTELRGRDDLRLYGLVQFGSIATIILLAVFWTSRYTRGADIFTVAGLYGLAKIFEWLDRPIFALGNTVSGHTLKHLAAAVACYWVLRMLGLRSPELGSVQEPAIAEPRA
jgi:hypothetical protein